VKRIAIVLAAGAATRFGGGKLVADFRGEPLLTHAIRAARLAPVERVIVVAPPGFDIGHWPDAPIVEVRALASTALSQSLATGVGAAIEADADAAFVFLGDMPLVPHGVAARLADAIGTAFAAVPTDHGKPGHPVLFARAAFSALAGLAGDEGAGRLLRGRDDVVRVAIDDPGIWLDVDVPADITRLDERQISGEPTGDGR
jgi:molybdenum cofactor cytidylyltransferase